MVILPVEKRIDWKKPPVVLIGIVLLNILIFAFYQINDGVKFQKAVASYSEHQLLSIELNAYQAYLNSHNEKLDPELTDDLLALSIVADNDFKLFIDENYQNYISEEQQPIWLENREIVNDLLNSISSSQLGLNSLNPNLLTLLTHQFLHGGIMHLIGNLVFLILTGFAVEAALGARRFLAYYLLSGIGGGLFYCITAMLTDGASQNLVGASGAISGVMAMYVALFRLRKIQFFYWIFVFTGYFRAAAIILLPAYILNEVFMLLTLEESNVAYTAHIGGFITGAALILATQYFDKKAIDENYLDGTEEITDPYLGKLQSLYLNITNCDFKKAWPELQKLKSEYPKKADLTDIEYNLLLALDKRKARDYLENKIGKINNTQHIVEAQARLWSLFNDDEKAKYDTETKLALANDFLSFEIVSSAEQIYKTLVNEKVKSPEMASVARRLSMYFQQQGSQERSDRYNQQAIALMSN